MPPRPFILPSACAATLLLAACSPYMEGQLPLDMVTAQQFSFRIDRDGEGTLTCRRPALCNIRKHPLREESTRTLPASRAPWLREELEGLVRDSILTPRKEDAAYSDFSVLEMQLSIKGKPYYRSNIHLAPSGKARPRIEAMNEKLGHLFNQ